MSKHQLYRHFDSNGSLLYVGISLQSTSRLIGHKTSSVWFAKITTITVEQFTSRQEALLAEKSAILKEKPLYNKVHNGFQPRKTTSNKKLFAIGITLTPNEYDLIKQAAEIQQRTASNYARLILVEAARNEVNNQTLR